MIKTPDVVNLDKSHVSFCGKAFRFRQEIERSLHETKSEISWNRAAWVHETKSEFVEGRGERCTKSSRNSSGKGESGRTKLSRNSSGKGESGCTKPSRNSSRRWRRCRTKPSRNSAKAGERRCTKSCRNSSVCGRRPPRHCQRVRHRTAGERGERLSSQRRKRRCPEKKKIRRICVGFFV